LQAFLADDLIGCAGPVDDPEASSDPLDDPVAVVVGVDL
jgi:hypothetical protein